MRLKVLCESWNSQEQRPDADQDASFHILRPLRYPLPGCHELLTMTDQTKGRCYIAAQGLQRGDGNGPSGAQARAIAYYQQVRGRPFSS